MKRPQRRYPNGNPRLKVLVPGRTHVLNEASPPAQIIVILLICAAGCATQLVAACARAATIWSKSKQLFLSVLDDRHFQRHTTPPHQFDLAKDSSVSNGTVPQRLLNVPRVSEILVQIQTQIDFMKA